MLLIPAKPFTNGGRRGSEQLGCGLDPALLGAFDQSQAMAVRTFHFTHQIEIAGGGGHVVRILRGARGPAPPPPPGRAPRSQKQIQFPSTLLTHALQPRQGIRCE